MLFRSSALAFACVLLLGFATKGFSRRASRVTFVEAGAGMEEGTGSRWRAFFSPFAQDISIRPTSSSGVIAVATDGLGSGIYVSDPGGFVLRGIESTPSQTAVLREDGLISLGGSIAIVRDGDDIVVANRTPSELRAVVLRVSNKEVRYTPSLAPGASLRMSDLPQPSRAFEAWANPGTPLDSARGLDGYALRDALSQEGEDEAGRIWGALDEGNSGTWFPRGVPVLLALMAPPATPIEDSGVKVERDLRVVRVVGYGGELP